MSQMHDLHPGLKKFRQMKAERKQIATAKKMFPNAATETIAKNLMKMAMRDGLVKE